MTMTMIMTMTMTKVADLDPIGEMVMQIHVI